MIKRYDILTTPNDRHEALVRRVSDGRTATVDVRWLKQDGDAHVPVSRVKAIRLDYMVEWKAEEMK